MKILFYGDSNTWGYQGDDPTHRLPYSKRFVGVVAGAFPQHRFVEEGLPGRTICCDDPMDESRNGLHDLPMLLQTHDPIDLICIMLGTNDTKCMFGHTAYTIGLAMEKTIQMVRNTARWCITGHCPKIMLIAPPSMGDITTSGYYGMFDEHSTALIPQIAAQYKALAERYNCAFVDGSQVVAQTCSDHVHMTEAEHAALGQMIIRCMKESQLDELA